MNHRQAHAYYRQQSSLFAGMWTETKRTADALEAQYAKDLGSAPVEDVDRTIRAGYAAASAALEMLMSYANAAVNQAASKSRFGGPARAETVHRSILPEIEAAKARVASWEGRAQERSVTLPTVRDGVDIALLADAELRDVYGAFGVGQLDASAVKHRVDDVAARFQITPDELAQWHDSQGFAPAG